MMPSATYGLVARAPFRDAWRFLTVGIVLSLIAGDGPPSARAHGQSVVSLSDLEAGPETASTIRDQADSLKTEQYAIATRLTKAYPNNFDALRVMGYVHSCHGNVDQMLKCWQQCRRLQPNRADIHDQLGRHSSKIQQYEDAIAHWQEAVRIDTKLPGIRQQIGNALLSLGRPEDAVVALNGEIEISPKTSQTHYLLGEAFLQLRDFALAKKSYQEAVRLQPNHKHAYYGLVKACVRLGQDKEASSYAEDFQRLESAAIQSDLDARRNYDDLQQMRQKLAVTCTDSGRVYLTHNRPGDAERLWTRASSLDATNAECRNLLAALYQQEGRNADALRQYLDLIRLDRRNLGYHQQIGFLHARLGNFSSAESALKKMLTIAPKSSDGYRALAKLYLNTKRHTKLAHQLAVTAVRLEPIADSYFVLAWSSAAMGDLPRAQAAAKRAVRLDPDNASYRKLYDSIQTKK